MFWWAALLAQLVGVIFVILSADYLFHHKNQRLDGRQSPKDFEDKRLAWFVLELGLILVFFPYYLNWVLAS